METHLRQHLKDNVVVLVRKQETVGGWGKNSKGRRGRRSCKRGGRRSDD